MKFENPIINISMFEVENIVTSSGGGSGEQPTTLNFDKALEQAKNDGYNAVLQITF